MEEALIKIDICSDLHVDAHHGKTVLLSEPGKGPSHWPIGHQGDRDKFFHFDFNWYRNPGSDTIIIAGDVSNDLDDLFGVLEQACKFYDHVVFTDGNHEHYSGTTIDENCDAIMDFKQSLPNLIYLDGEDFARHDIGRTAFIGGNCWYDWKCFEDKGVSFPTAFASWDRYSNDRHLNFGSAGWPSVIGSAQVLNVIEAVKSANADPNIDSIVMVTHTAPLAECLRWDPIQMDFNKSSPSYANSELKQVFTENTNNKIRAWAYGHTHTRRSWDYQDVMMVNNCYGYPNENTGGWFMANIEV